MRCRAVLWKERISKWEVREMKGLLIKDYRLMSRGFSAFNFVFIMITYCALGIADMPEWDW